MAEELRESQKIKPPPSVEDRLNRGRNRLREESAHRNECHKFTRGEQYVYTKNHKLIVQPTTGSMSEQSGKLPWRVRSVRNLIFDVVEREVANALSRVPGYEVTPTTSDPEDVGAARLAEKVALYGYDAWYVRNATEDAVRHAVIADGGYVWPYFDNSIGPFIETEDGRVGMGDIRFRVFGGNEVGWEPGLSFAESPWHFVEQAMDPKRVEEMDGYVGGKLHPDAEAQDETNKDSIRGAKLVLVTDYLERPCAEYPEGRWITLANKRVIIDERPYPCTDPDGEPLDEPILHQLCYSRDPDNDRPQGLVTHLLDPQRNVNLSVSKAIEWEKLALNPQLVIQNGALAEGQRLTDEPGAVYNAFGSGQINWRPVPPVPQELFTIKEQAEGDMGKIAAQNDVPANIEAGKAITALLERDSSRRNNFITNLADFHSRLMRHALYLVAKHYTDERLLKVRGRFGPESIKDFRGSQLRSQVDVRVWPASLEPRTKQAVEQRVMNYAQLGWINPEQAMSAVNSGTAENLIQSYELDYARANLVIQKIRDGSFLNSPMRPVMPGEDAGPKIDPMTGQPMVQTNPDGTPVMAPDPTAPPVPTGQVDEMGMPITEPAMVPQYVQETELPEWMPRPFDNLRVHKQQLTDWLKTSDYDELDAGGKEAANLYYQALLDLEAKETQRAAEQQQAQAEAQGDFNAAKPQQASPLPSLPGQQNQSS